MVPVAPETICYFHISGDCANCLHKSLNKQNIYLFVPNILRVTLGLSKLKICLLFCIDCIIILHPFLHVKDFYELCHLLKFSVLKILDLNVDEITMLINTFRFLLY